MTVITQIQGGLGNQMFQYAFGRALSLARHTELVLDTRWYGAYQQDVTPRPFLLSYLRIQADIEIYPKSIGSPGKMRRALQTVLPISPFILSEKSDYIFDRSVFARRPFSSNAYYLRGYWQSYRYFEGIRLQLLEEFTINTPLDSHYKKYLKLIDTTNSVMVHVRRGDYVALASAAAVHGGVVDLTYYERAMAWILGSQPDVHFYIFSDDQDWAREFLPYKGKCIFVDSLDGENAVVQELMLMRACHHHIIANSSLSWWGAWLSQNLGSQSGLVACPKRWINREHYSGDLLPSTWRQF